MAKTKRNKKKEKVADEQTQRYFLEIKEQFVFYRNYMQESGFSKEEKDARLEEIDRTIKVIEKFRKNSLNPVKDVITVMGTKFKIGDKFSLKGGLQTKYTITLFPDSLHVRGHCSNPKMGEPWTCEAYIEDIVKIKDDKLPKWVKEGAYFQLLGTGTFFKIEQVLKDTQQIVGTNKLQYMGAKTNAKVHISHIKEATKADYKNQHKPEKEEPKKKKDDKKNKKKNKNVVSEKKDKQASKKSKKKNKR